VAPWCDVEAVRYFGFSLIPVCLLFSKLLRKPYPVEESGSPRRPFVSLALRSSAARSSFVQAHGVRREAVILNVDNIAHMSTTTTGSGSGKHTVTSTTYTAEVLVRLADPVDGQARQWDKSGVAGRGLRAS